MGGQLIGPRKFVFGVFAAGLIGIACYALIGYFAAPFVGRLIFMLPTQYLYPFIFMTALAASYSPRASIWDVAFALFFGIVGMRCGEPIFCGLYHRLCVDPWYGRSSPIYDHF